MTARSAGLVVQDPYRMGYDGIKTALAASKGEKVEANVDTGANLVTKANMNEPKIERAAQPQGRSEHGKRARRGAPCLRANPMLGGGLRNVAMRRLSPCTGKPIIIDESKMAASEMPRSDA